MKTKNKTKNYTHLITIGEAEAKMIQELLWKHKIPSELRPTSEADVLAGRAVHGNLPYEVRVPEELLEKAKQIFNFEKTINLEEKRGYPRWVVLIAWIFILGIIFMILLLIIPLIILK